MTDIPADILAAADIVVACVNVDTSDRNKQIKYVALAIANERERCAKIAEGRLSDQDWPGETWVCGVIAKDIRQGIEPISERKAIALEIADWMETQRKDVPAHGWEFAASIRQLFELDAVHINPSLSDRQYLEKIADQVIARNQLKAETSREASPAAETVSAQSGAGVVSVCPALIDDVGGGA